MPVGRDRIYQEAVALWRTMTDEPPPEGDAGQILEAAIRLSTAQDYERFQNRWLADPNIAWAVYRQSPSRLA